MRLPGRVPSAHVDTYARALLPPTELWPRFDYSAEYLSHYPDRVNASVALLDSAVAEGYGNKPALYYEDTVWTYAQLLDRVKRIARVLVDDLGLVPGNRVLLRALNTPMLAACWLAVVRVGGIPATTHPMLRAQELTYIIDKVRINLALCEGPLAAELEAARSGCESLKNIVYFTALGASRDAVSLDYRTTAKPADCGWADTAADDIAMICFTSGTTGKPKAAAHFHRDILASTDCWAQMTPIPPGEVFCGPSSMGFTYGISSNVLYPLRYRCAVSLLAKPTTENLLAAIERHRVTTLCTVPTALFKLLESISGHDISSLKRIASSGEQLRASLWHGWYNATGIQIVEGLGSTEVLARAVCQLPEVERVGASGKASPGFTVRLIDEDGNTVPPGGRGRIALYGPTGCKYLGDPERQRVFVQNGWNVPGDVLEQDEQGYFWYVDRADNMIISAGYTISSIEVERVIASHPKVLDCGVVGVPDPARGKIVCAYVQLRDPREASEKTAAEIQAFVKATIAPYKYPRQIKFLDELPKTVTGKTQRHLLEQAERRAGKGGA